MEIKYNEHIQNGFKTYELSQVKHKSIEVSIIFIEPDQKEIPYLILYMKIKKSWHFIIIFSAT